jgi:hypothetical protein
MLREQIVSSYDVIRLAAGLEEVSRRLGHVIEVDRVVVCATTIQVIDIRWKKGNFSRNCIRHN